MKVLICGDVHWSTYASILRKRGVDFSKRLENCINSINWVEQTAEEYNCDRVIYLGDWFDRADINSEEASALRQIVWGDIPHTVIVGNHELGSANGDYSTAQLFSLLPSFDVKNTPTMEIGYKYRFVFLPYIFEKDRKPIEWYINNLSHGMFETQEVKYTYIFSHNDIKGVNYGIFESTSGFDIQDIDENCTLFFNGHIHNGKQITDKIINVGNITGQNFNEDATLYDHRVIILDTDNMTTKTIVNPYAYNFYKIEVTSIADANDKLSNLKSHSVISVKCPESIIDDIRKILSENPLIEEYRIVTVAEDTVSPKEDIKQLIASDHLSQFKDYVISKMGKSDLLLSELQEVLSGN